MNSSDKSVNVNSFATISGIVKNEAEEKVVDERFFGRVQSLQESFEALPCAFDAPDSPESNRSPEVIRAMFNEHILKGSYRSLHLGTAIYKVLFSKHLRTLFLVVTPRAGKVPNERSMTIYIYRVSLP